MRIRNEELGMRNEGMLFCKKLLWNRGVAQQRKPKLFTPRALVPSVGRTINYSLFAHLHTEVS